MWQSLMKSENITVKKLCVTFLSYEVASENAYGLWNNNSPSPK